MVTSLIRLENLVVFAVGLLLYWQMGFNWWLFLLLILTPDISMIGYTKDSKLGAVIYNLVHNYVLAIGLVVFGHFVLEVDWLTMYGLILLCHIGMDRVLGFGLKYPSGFKDSHMQNL